jgi:hypothetical protein
MDNRLNEIRRMIKYLRMEMLAAEEAVRKQINRDEDCSETALQVLKMRSALLGLIHERNALGGGERLLDVDERLQVECRAATQKVLLGPRGRRKR